MPKFPGRLNEQKKFHVGFWLATISVVALFVWLGSMVVAALRAPLTPQQKREIASESAVGVSGKQSGIIGQKADSFVDDIGQIRKGQIFKHAPARTYSGPVVYDNKASEKKKTTEQVGDSYYSDHEAGGHH